MTSNIQSLEEIHEMKRIRLMLGLSQLKMASELGVSATHVCRIEQGFKPLSTELKDKLHNLKLFIESELSKKQNGGDQHSLI